MFTPPLLVKLQNWIILNIFLFSEYANFMYCWSVSLEVIPFQMGRYTRLPGTLMNQIWHPTVSTYNIAFGAANARG